MLTEHLDHALRGAVALVDRDDPAPGGQVVADVGDRLLDVAPIGVRRVGGHLARAAVLRDARGTGLRVEALEVEPEGADPPPRLALREHLLAHLADALQRRGSEVDRRLATGGGSGPAGAEELVAGGHEVVGAGADALGVEHEHVGLWREQLDQQLHLVDQRRGQGLHALDGDALGQLVGQLAQLGVLGAQLGGAAAYGVGEEELAARRGPEPLHPAALVRPHGALVGHGEEADLVDLVAEELHPDGVLVGGREDVDDAAADGVLATLLDQVDAGVRRAREARDDVLERDLLARLQLHRLEVGETLDLRLEDRADRGDDDLERPVDRVGAGVLEPAQHGQPATHGVAARAEPLVGQRLPGRVERDGVGVEQVGELGGEVLGLAHRRRDDEDRAAGVDQALDHERSQGRGTGQVEGRQTVARVVHRPGERGVAQDHLGEAGKPPGLGHHLLQDLREARTKCPRSCATGGLARSLRGGSDSG